MLSSVNDKITSLESQIKHQGSLLTNLVLKLHDFRKQNVNLKNELVRMRSLETRSDGVLPVFLTYIELDEVKSLAEPSVVDIRLVDGFVVSACWSVTL